MSDLDLILGYQLAEFDAASRYRRYAVFGQLIFISTIIAAVFVDDHIILYVLAAFALALSIAVLFLDRSYKKHRSIAERARRLTLIYGGLGWDIPPTEILALKSECSINEQEAIAAFKPGYFASRSPAGYGRLGGMLEESAFWTEDLQRISAWAMVVALSFLILFGLTAVTMAFSEMSDDNFVSAARIGLAILTAIFSADGWGVMMGHFEYSAAAKKVKDRLQSLEAIGYPHAPLLVVLNDYNAAAEAGPLSLPLIYGRRQAHLNKLWHEYEQRRAAAGPAK